MTVRRWATELLPQCPSRYRRRESLKRILIGSISPMDSSAPLYEPAEEHELLRRSVRELAEAEIAPYAAEVDAKSRFPDEAYAALKQAELHAVHIPEAYGGAGAD